MSCFEQRYDNDEVTGEMMLIFEETEGFLTAM
jgi:hypothetical protein